MGDVMDLSLEEVEMLHFFCFVLIPEYHQKKYSMPQLHFIFEDDDYEAIISHLEELLSQKRALYLEIKTYLSNRNIMVSDIEKTVDLIKRNQESYKKSYDENANYILVNDYKRFFELLNQLMSVFEENSLSNNFEASSLLRSIWLRMGPSDMENVESFLKRQISFIENDYLLPTSQKELYQIGNIYVSYYNHGNQNYFETNRHIRILLKRKIGEMAGFYPDSKINLYENYFLPAVHYGLTKEDDEKTCYIYGVQQLDEREQDPIVKNIIQEERRRLRNKYVSPDFIIALKIFVDILREKGITTIKIPLMQVFNYEYHQNMGNMYHEKLKSISPERINDLELMNAPEYAIADYENIKKQHARFYEKEDAISANKTERFLFAIYLMAEKYENIEILTEPFVESDILICKINYQKDKHL